MDKYRTLARNSQEGKGSRWEAILILSAAAGVLVILLSIPLAIVSFQLDMADMAVMSGEDKTSLLSPLYPYKETMKSLLFPGFFTGFGLVMGAIFLRRFRRSIMRARIRALGVVVPGVVQKVYKSAHTTTRSGGNTGAHGAYSGSSSSTSYHVTLFLEVKPPGEQPFEATVNEESLELFEMNFVEGSTIALLYEPKIKYVLIPEQGFDKIKHEIRRKEASRSLSLLLKNIVQHSFGKSGGVGGLVFMLIVIFLPLTPVFFDFPDLAGMMVYAVPVIVVLVLITIYSGLTSYDGLESQKKEENSPVLY